MQPVGCTLEEARGGDVDDLAPLLRLHGWEHSATGEEHAAQVDRHHTIPLLDRDFEPGAARQHAHQRGVVDEYVDRAEAIERGTCHRFGRIFARDIDAEPERRKALGSKRLGHSLGGRLVDVRRHHACADASEFLGGDLADALAATGDDDGAVFKIEAFVWHDVRHWRGRNETGADRRQLNSLGLERYAGLALRRLGAMPTW